MAKNFTHRHLKQSPSLSSAFTNCFIKPSLMCVAVEELSLVSPMVHTRYFSHEPLTQFVWASLVSRNGPFLHGCPTNKESRDAYCILLVVLETCTQSSNLQKFSSCALNTLTSQALASYCHRFFSFEPSDLWEWRQIHFHCAVEHTSNFFWSYQ